MSEACAYKRCHKFEREIRVKEIKEPLEYSRTSIVTPEISAASPTAV